MNPQSSFRLEAILKGARTSTDELSAFLDARTARALGITDDELRELRTLLSAHVAAQMRQRSDAERMFQPTVLNGKAVLIDPFILQEIAEIEAKGTAQIRSCREHGGGRCPNCWWRAARHELFRFQERHEHDADAVAAATESYERLEELSRSHRPPRGEPDPLTESLIATLRDLAEATREKSEPAWLGKRRKK